MYLIIYIGPPSVAIKPLLLYRAIKYTIHLLYYIVYINYILYSIQNYVLETKKDINAHL